MHHLPQALAHALHGLSIPPFSPPPPRVAEAAASLGAAAGRGGGVDLSLLSIVSGKTCWVLYVDALLLNIGGNLHDAVSVAAKVRAGQAVPDGPCCRWQRGGGRQRLAPAPAAVGAAAEVHGLGNLGFVRA